MTNANLDVTQKLQARLIEAEYKLDRVRHEVKEMQRMATTYGMKGISNIHLERLDSQLLALSKVRDEIREVFSKSE